MVHKDTIGLLKECDSGIQVTVHALDEILPAIESPQLLHQLEDCRKTHKHLANQTQHLLQEYKSQGKHAPTSTKAMHWVKSNVKLAMQPGDHSIADLVIDECNWGVKTLHKHENRYSHASTNAKNIVQQLITEQSRISRDMSHYL